MHKQFGLLISRALIGVAFFVVALLIFADSHETEESVGDSEDAGTDLTAEVQDESVAENLEADIIDPISIEAGALLAETLCTACHGTDGNSNNPTNGNLAGQNERYLYQQIVLIKSLVREVPTMNISLENLDDDDMLSLAMYYASLEGRIGQANPAIDLKLGESIYRGGILEKEVAACTACHAPNGNGNLLAGFPRISGQTVQYLEAQLKAYREGERTTDEEYGGMMRDIAKKLTDGEIRAVANYMTGLY